MMNHTATAAKADYVNSELTAATDAANAARISFATATTVKARRLAAEDLEFWSNRVAFLTHAR